MKFILRECEIARALREEVVESFRMNAFALGATFDEGTDDFAELAGGMQERVGFQICRGRHGETELLQPGENVTVRLECVGGLAIHKRNGVQEVQNGLVGQCKKRAHENIVTVFASLSGYTLSM